MKNPFTGEKLVGNTFSDILLILLVVGVIIPIGLSFF